MNHFKGQEQGQSGQEVEALPAAGRPPAAAAAAAPALAFFDFFALEVISPGIQVEIVSNGLTLAPVGLLGRSTNVPFILAMMSESPRAKSSRIGLS